MVILKLLQKAKKLASGVGFRGFWRCVNTAEGYWPLIAPHRGSSAGAGGSCIILERNKVVLQLF